LFTGIVTVIDAKYAMQVKAHSDMAESGLICLNLLYILLKEIGLSRQLGTLEKMRLNHDVCVLMVGKSELE
jgi:hypothetical protein